MWLSLLFFFKQKTAYEMRISDWSSDVCSSDLTRGTAQAVELRRISAFAKAAHRAGFKVHAGHGLTTANVAALARIPPIVELNIGHSIVDSPLLLCFPAPVAEMTLAIKDGRRARIGLPRHARFGVRPW